MKKIIPVLTLTALLCPFLPAQEEARPVRPQQREGRQAEAAKPDWDSLKKRIEGAVERGDMTRDQANQKYAEIKKNLAPPGRQRDARPSPQRPDVVRPMVNRDRPDALGRVIGELVSQNKINREDARRILEAARSHPPVQDRPRPDRDSAPMNQAHRMAEELHDVLNAAKKELAALREARERLGEHREGHGAELQERREHMEREQAVLREEMARAHAEMEQKRARMEAEAARMREEAERRSHELREQRQKLEESRRELQKKKSE